MKKKVIMEESLKDNFKRKKQRKRETKRQSCQKKKRKEKRINFSPPKMKERKTCNGKAFFLILSLQYKMIIFNFELIRTKTLNAQIN